jgi:CBS domain-containing protein
VGRVADILRTKGTDVVAIDVDASALDAACTMEAANIGAVLVREHGRIVGIVSERDFLRHLAVQGPSIEGTRVRDVMIAPVIAVAPETSVEECMALVTEKRIRHLPVMDGDVLAGIVSIGDLVKFESHEQHVRIRYLTEYIEAR